MHGLMLQSSMLANLYYAVTLCLDENPDTLVFEQSMMRTHLTLCIEQQCFSIFPIKSKRRKNLKISKTETVKVFCICRMPEMPCQPAMICCSRCSVWYHGGVCIPAVPKSAWSKKAHWSCPSCVAGY